MVWIENSFDCGTLTSSIISTECVTTKTLHLLLESQSCDCTHTHTHLKSAIKIEPIQIETRIKTANEFNVNGKLEKKFFLLVFSSSIRWLCVFYFSLNWVFQCLSCLCVFVQLWCVWEKEKRKSFFFNAFITFFSLNPNSIRLRFSSIPSFTWSKDNNRRGKNVKRFVVVYFGWCWFFILSVIPYSNMCWFFVIYIDILVSCVFLSFYAIHLHRLCVKLSRKKREKIHFESVWCSLSSISSNKIWMSP